MTTRLPDDLLQLAASQEDLLSTRQCDAHGISPDVRARLCRQCSWIRITRGVYDTAPGAARARPARRRRTALIGLLRYGPDAVAVGASALAMRGVEGLPSLARSEIALGGTQGREPLWRVRQRAVAAREPGQVVTVRQFDAGMRSTLVDGFHVATPQWALAQAVPELPRRNAVAVMDSLLHQRLLDRDGLGSAHRLARGRRGVARTHPWWGEADGRAESALESFGRLDCIDHGVPPDDLQMVVRDGRGRFLGRGDLGWRLRDRRWLVAELDGREFHEDLGALLHDRDRQNELHLSGRAEVLRFTYQDLTPPGTIAAVVRRALRRWA